MTYQSALHGIKLKPQASNHSSLFNDHIETLNQLPKAPISMTSDQIRIEFGKQGRPVRKVNKRSNARVTGKFPSRKNNASVSWESTIELAGFQIMEAHSLVISYKEQPAFIRYTLDGVAHYHVPDVLVELASGKMCFIEFKDISYLHDQKLIRRTEFLAAHLPSIGYSYVVVIPDQMGTVITKNAEKLNRFARASVSLQIREVFKGVMDSIPLISMGSLLDILLPTGLGRGELFGLIRQGDIAFNWQEPLTPESLLVWRDAA